MANPKAPRQRAKDLSAVGKKSYKNADKNNRGLGSAGEYPEGWCQGMKHKMKGKMK